MDIESYKNIVTSITPKVKDKCYLKVFLSGGIMGFICEGVKLILINIGIDKNTSSSIVILSLIILACLFTAFFDMDKYVIKYKCGLIIPITGFSHSICSCALDYKKDGYINGLGTNFFKLAGSVLLYGMVSSFFLSILRVIIYG